MLAERNSSNNISYKGPKIRYWFILQMVQLLW